MAAILPSVTIAEVDAAIPPAKTRKDYDKKYRQTPKSALARARENSTKRDRSLERYLTKEFVAWDGEGFNNENGEHVYNLLANSDGQVLTNPEGITTEEAFEMMLLSRDGVHHIGYGLSYDINMILKDIPREYLQKLYDSGSVRWSFFWITWRRGKSLRIQRRNRSFLIYDVLPFFQRTFVAACDEYLGTDWEARDQIIAEKARRGTFTLAELNEVKDYNNAELRNLVRLACELRTRLWAVNIRISRWDGPGAIAAALYKKYETKSFQGAIPSEVAKAGRHAYAGGRFEIIRKGHSTNRAYQYDINSAYPAAIRNLPCLAHGTWIHTRYPTRIVPFGVYRIEVVESKFNPTQPQPLWMRNKDGTVYFAEYSHNWYWTPEAVLAQKVGGTTIHEGWEWKPTCNHKPFAFVEDLYKLRAELKRKKDGAHVGLKLGLNSLYGKLAQQIGWSVSRDGDLRLPPYHSLEWAGYVTSHCRAALFNAALENPDDIIAFETDAVFSRVPMSVKVGTGLGEWEQTTYDSLTYFKSGMSFGTLDDGTNTVKTRGINKGSLARETIIDALRVDATGEIAPPIQAEQTRFITIGQALHQNFDLWRRWITGPRMLSVELNGKRIDQLVSDSTAKHLDDGWRETIPAYSDTEFSFPYEVEWIEQSEMGFHGLTLQQVREMQSDSDIELYGGYE